MSRAAKIDRAQKAFLKAMREKFADDPDKSTWSKPARGFYPEPVYEVCPICNGRVHRKKAHCHSCGGTGWRKKKVQPRPANIRSGAIQPQKQS